jgi:uncharacterized protein YcfL
MKKILLSLSLLVLISCGSKTNHDETTDSLSVKSLDSCNGMNIDSLISDSILVDSINVSK